MSNFISTRQYPTIDNNGIATLKDIYRTNIQFFENKNAQKIAKDDKKILRIMTYNVHFWTNIDERDNIDNIITTIINIDPDIICLQEVKFSEFKTRGIRLLEIFEIMSFCNVTPSWFDDVYGNMILIKKELKTKLLLSDLSNSYNRTSCGINNRCYLSQFNHVYNDLDCCTNERPNIPIIPPIGNETRCFIKISLPNFDIINTHLEAYETPKRVRQLQELNKYITRITIVLGDFNMINIDDYSEDFKRNYLEKDKYKRFKDAGLGYDTFQSFQDNNIWEDIGKAQTDFVNLTTWNGTRIDYIFKVTPRNIIDCLAELKNIIERYFMKPAGQRQTQKSVLELFDYLHNTSNNPDIMIDDIISFYKNNYKTIVDNLSLSTFKKLQNEYMNIETFINDNIDKLIKAKCIKKNTDRNIFLEDTIYGTKILNKETENKIYFIKDSLLKIQQILNLKINKFEVYFNDASDHLPLFIDIEYDSIKSTSIVHEGLEEIETEQFYKQGQKIEVDVDKFIETFNNMNDTSNTKEKFLVYNGQPALNRTDEWIQFNSSISADFEPKDPFSYGASVGGNSLGNQGIYGASNYDRAYGWYETFSNGNIAKNIVDVSNQLNKTGIIFEIKLNLNIPDLKICYIGKDKEWINYNDELDSEYDIIVGEIFAEVKITNKRFNPQTRTNPVFSLNAKYVNRNDTLRDFYNFERINDNKYKLLEKTRGGGLKLENNYKEKYLKYKQKYLQLKKIIRDKE